MSVNAAAFAPGAVGGVAAAGQISDNNNTVGRKKAPVVAAVATPNGKALKSGLMMTTAVNNNNHLVHVKAAALVAADDLLVVSAIRRQHMKDVFQPWVMQVPLPINITITCISIYCFPIKKDEKKVFLSIYFIFFFVFLPRLKK